jgi:hypothetical protein
MKAQKIFYDDVPPRPVLTRPDDVARLLMGAVDLHCHSGPAAMPRILDHYDALMDCAEAKFRALVYKDHFYPGMAHAVMLERLVPNTGVELFSGIALNNASGGINPHAVDHALRLGAKIVWMPTLAAKNHIDQTTGAAKDFPKTAEKMLAPIPLTCLDANGRLTDETKLVLDLIAEADVILAGGHLHVSEQHILFAEAKARGVKKMLVNHPTYVIGCTDQDMRDLATLGVFMEHEIGMFVPGRAQKGDARDLRRLIDLVGVDRVVLCSDLGLRGSPRPVDGYGAIVQGFLDLDMPEADIKRLISTNAAAMLNLPA